MKEYILEFDLFKKPLIKDGARADALKVIRLILLNPGSDPLHPDMGVGLKNYRFGDKSVINELKKRTMDQISKYLPDLAATDVDFIMTTDKVLAIDVMTPSEIFEFNYELSPSMVELEDIRR